MATWRPTCARAGFTAQTSNPYLSASRIGLVGFSKTSRKARDTFKGSQQDATWTDPTPSYASVNLKNQRSQHLGLPCQAQDKPTGRVASFCKSCMLDARQCKEQVDATNKSHEHMTNQPAYWPCARLLRGMPTKSYTLQPNARHWHPFAGTYWSALVMCVPGLTRSQPPQWTQRCT